VGLMFSGLLRGNNFVQSLAWLRCFIVLLDHFDMSTPQTE